GLHCASPQSSLVLARFGTLARGVLRVRATELPAISAPGSTTLPPLRYDTATDDEFLELHHPSFPGGGFDYPPRLYITIASGVVTGRILFFPGIGRVQSIGLDRWLGGLPWERMFGWNGLAGGRPTPAFVHGPADGG